MCLAAFLSQRLGLLKPAEVERVFALIARAGLPLTPPEELDLDIDRLVELMAVDKKNLDGKLRLIGLETIGRATLPRPVSVEILKSTLNEYGRSIG
jgi:3-dehydroquinate synthase